MNKIFIKQIELYNLNIIDNWNIYIKEKNKGLFMIGIFFMINIYYVTPIKIIYKYDLINRTGINLIFQILDYIYYH